MKYEVRSGKEFPVDSADVLRARTGLIRERICGYGAIALITLVAVFLMGAAVLGVFEEKFEKLEMVWREVDYLVFLFIGYYWKDTHITKAHEKEKHPPNY